MKITLDLTTDEAIFVKDALVDRSLDLRTNSKGIIMRENVFLDDEQISARRKYHYKVLRDTADAIANKISSAAS